MLKIGFEPGLISQVQFIFLMNSLVDVSVLYSDIILLLSRLCHKWLIAGSTFFFYILDSNKQNNTQQTNNPLVGEDIWNNFKLQLEIWYREILQTFKNS